VDGPGGLFQALATAIVGLFGGAVRAFGDAVQGVFGAFQSVLPGLWLPVVAIAVVIFVGWNLARR
jgi:hypothetical protein